MGKHARPKSNQASPHHQVVPQTQAQAAQAQPSHRVSDAQPQAVQVQPRHQVASAQSAQPKSTRAFTPSDSQVAKVSSIGRHQGGQHKSDYTNPENYRHRKKKRSKVPFIILGVVLAVLIGAGVAFGLYMNNVANQLNKGTKSDEELLAISDALGGYKNNFHEVFYMLLVGTDAREGEDTSRSDTNIVVRVDPNNYTVSMVSIPRDTMITIPGYGTQKFNAAYAYGKIPGVIDAAEKLMGVEITHYAEVNFNGLKDIVDAVGGITVDVEGKVDDWHCDDGDGNHYVLEPGVQRLNGGQALTYARSRYAFAEGDYARASHQRQVIEAIVKEVLAQPFNKIPEVIEKASKAVTTDISIPDIIGLAQSFSYGDGGITMYNAVIPSSTDMVDGVSYVVVDTAKFKEMLKLFVSGEDPSKVSENKASTSIDVAPDTETYSYGNSYGYSYGGGTGTGTGTGTGNSYNYSYNNSGAGTGTGSSY